MSLVDVGIVLFVIALAAVGYTRGLIASALPLVGFVGGIALGARVGPTLLPDGAESSYAVLPLASGWRIRTLWRNAILISSSVAAGDTPRIWWSSSSCLAPPPHPRRLAA